MKLFKEVHHRSLSFFPGDREAKAQGAVVKKLPDREAAGISGCKRKKGSQGKPSDPSGKMAGWTGLEPAASGVTGRRYNQLNYHPETKATGRQNRT